jgi:hypothetical protein
MEHCLPTNQIGEPSSKGESERETIVEPLEDQLGLLFQTTNQEIFFIKKRL